VTDIPTGTVEVSEVDDGISDTCVGITEVGDSVDGTVEVPTGVSLGEQLFKSNDATSSASLELEMADL